MIRGGCALPQLYHAVVDELRLTRTARCQEHELRRRNNLLLTAAVNMTISLNSYDRRAAIYDEPAVGLFVNECGTVTVHDHLELLPHLVLQPHLRRQSLVECIPCCLGKPQALQSPPPPAALRHHPRPPLHAPPPAHPRPQRRTPQSRAG